MKKLIYINFTSKCNYKCEYCPPFLSDNKAKDEEIDYVGLNIFINSFDDQIGVLIYGGEPTVSHQFYPLLNFLCDHKNVYKVDVISNGSKYIDISPKDKRYDKVKLYYSFHRSQTTFKEFIKNINKSYVDIIFYMGFIDEKHPDYNEYKMLKKIYKDKIEFRPIINNINMGTAEYEAVPSSNIAYDKIEKEGIDKIEIASINNYFFRRVNGKTDLSLYDLWKMNEVSNTGKPCYIRFFSYYVKNNRVYHCFSERAEKVLDEKFAKSFYDFKNTEEIITCECNKCYFNSFAWEKFYDTDYTLLPFD